MGYIIRPKDKFHVEQNAEQQAETARIDHIQAKILYLQEVGNLLDRMATQGMRPVEQIISVREYLRRCPR